MIKCLFCGVELNPGSIEHVFLAGLGGRVATRQATCCKCNNSFATGDKVDDAVIDAFKPVSCALMIWTGNGSPPPTIAHAGTFQDGTEYDLAPGFVPVVRPARIPTAREVAGRTSFPVIARDAEDARRAIKILESRPGGFRVRSFFRRASIPPCTELTLEFDERKVARSLAKTALAGACLMYGNTNVRNRCDPNLISSVRTGSPEIADFAGSDYANPWPSQEALALHRSSRDHQRSGFEHKLFITDVGDAWVAYITIYGHFRFSVRLGSASHLESKGMAVNPRSITCSRFYYSAEVPQHYDGHYAGRYQTELATIATCAKSGMEAVLKCWHAESIDASREKAIANLATRVAAAGPDEATIRDVIDGWVAEIVTTQRGDTWREEIDRTIIDEESESDK